MTAIPEDLRTIVELALSEDAPAGDLTTQLVVAEGATCRAELRAGARGVVAGVRTASAVFDLVAEQDGGVVVDLDWEVKDGDSVSPGERLCLITGPARAILRAERVAINFLSHLSGVATLTRAFVEAASPAEVLCTRKTVPGLRALQREAVLAGGGSLHRASLSEAVLIKENHQRVAGGITEAVRRARARGAPVEMEVETLEELDEALRARADRILLDNPTPELVREATSRSGGPDRIEISGGVTLDSVGSLVEAGARLVSVGRLTHSAPALDMSLEVIDARSV